MNSWKRTGPFALDRRLLLFVVRNERFGHRKRLIHRLCRDRHQLSDTFSIDRLPLALEHVHENIDQHRIGIEQGAVKIPNEVFQHLPLPLPLS